MRVIIASCSFCLLFPAFLGFSQEGPGSTDALATIKETDLAMSVMAQKVGFWKALLSFADENIVKLSDGEYPVVGKKAFKEKIGGKTGTTALSWSPVGGEVAGSGDLGFTWGNWKLAAQDTTIYGNYFSVWKRAGDGSWKLLLDGGNSTPPPPQHLNH